MVPDRKQSRVFAIGLTGIFGSGKSTVAKLFRSHGVKVINCDALAKEVYSSTNPINLKIKRLLGLNKLERKKIAQLIFNNQRKRRQLEALIHPYVFHRISEELRKIKRGLVVIEIPLLFETGFDKQVDMTAVVSARQEIIRSRLLRKGFSIRDIRARWQAQWPLQRKIKASHLVINNSGTRAALQKQVAALLKKLKRTGIIN